jgi:hypothetical protein
MDFQATNRALVCILMFLLMTLFSVSSQAENCHDSSQNKIDSTNQTIQNNNSYQDVSNTSMCDGKIFSVICCQSCKSCKISREIFLEKNYIGNKRDKAYQNKKVFYKDVIIKKLMRNSVALNIQRTLYTNINTTSANIALKYRVIQI